MNILIVAPYPALLTQQLSSNYRDVHTSSTTDLAHATACIHNHLVTAVVLDDRVGNVDALFDTVAAATRAGIPILLHIVGPARYRMADLQDCGAHTTTELPDADLLRWIARVLDLTAVRGSKTRLLATASAKGGASKTTLLVHLAEAFAACGLKVLLVENDLSNAALRQVYGCGPELPSYVELAADGDTRGITPSSLRHYCHTVRLGIRDRMVNLDLLLGPVSAASQYDLKTHHSELLFQSITQMDYDLVLVDTGPEIMRRPTAFFVLQAGGKVIVPCPTGVLEREGAVNLLATIRNVCQNFLEGCSLVFVEPERGSISANDLPQIRRHAAAQFPMVSHLGIVPRDARAISIAAAYRVETGRYESILHVAPYSQLSRTVWSLARNVAAWLDLALPQAPPSSRWWNRLFQRGQVATLPMLDRDNTMLSEVGGRS